MTYEEYRILIKARFEEIQNKASFEFEDFKTVVGFSQSVSHNGVTAHIAMALCAEIKMILDQISDYANGMIDQIKEDAKREQNEKIERVKKIWNDETSDRQCRDCGLFTLVSEEGIGCCDKDGKTVFGNGGACKDWEQKNDN